MLDSRFDKVGFVQRLASVSIFPLVVAAMAAFAVYGSTLDPARALGLAPAANAALLSLAAVVAFYTGVALLERLHPYRPEWNRSIGDQRTDVLHLLVTGPGTNAVFQATLAGALVVVASWLSARFGRGLWPEEWPALAQLALALWIAEFGHYWFHRVSHESALVWRVHAVHHSAPRLYWLNATRFHPLDLFGLIALQSTPLILLGAPKRTLIMYALFSIVYGQLQHCNIEVRTPRLVDWIFSSPGLHRWHHSTDTREGNHNYGAILIFWDLLFGSFFRPADRAFAGPVGIGDLPRFPQRYLAQLASPFRWSRIRRESAPTS